MNQETLPHAEAIAGRVSDMHFVTMCAMTKHSGSGKRCGGPVGSPTLTPIMGGLHASPRRR